MTKENAEKILQILRKEFTIPKWTRMNREPFKTLIMTIISQNTADRNTAKAFEKLSKHFEIAPEVLANAETNQIEECLKVAGLYRNKAKAIKHVSKILLEKFNGDIARILSMPSEQARKTLMQLPGIGPKTTDVVLLFCSENPTIPVDTHVNRVARRLGLAPAQGDYEKVRKYLQSLYSPKNYLAVHVLFILHGREHCRARKPLCKMCPLNKLCPSKLLY